MIFGILGPLAVWSQGRLVHIGGSRQQRLLACLLLDAGRVITVERLIHMLWDEAPETAVKQIHNGIALLRRDFADGGLASEMVRTRGRGYQLAVDPKEVDAGEFARLTELARRLGLDGSIDAAVDQLHAALSLWRGPALAEFPGSIMASAARLEEQRLAAIIEYSTYRLRLGRNDEAVSDLIGWVEQFPGRERLISLLMLGLYRASRQAEALSLFQSQRKRLAEEFGVDPGTELQRLHTSILRADPALYTDEALYEPARRPPGTMTTDPPAEAPTLAPAPLPAVAPNIVGRRAGLSAGVASGAIRPVPAQLPGDIATFTGREKEIARLDAMLTASSGQLATVVISAVSGSAGVGKTALAVHWAHRVRARFPDGQLYVNLRGFDPSAEPMSHAEAIRGFLDALSVSPQQIPASLHAQTGLYRSLLAERRMFVMLDNARDADHVRALLPGSPGSLVLVTSRNRLTSLAVTEGAQPLMLDVLSPTDARRLLIRRLGPDRVIGQPEMVDEIIALCARLPLALAIVAARAAAQSHRELADITMELRERRLDRLDAGDQSTNLRAVFSWSYRTLTAPAARLFRVLGTHPGPDISAAAAASLAGLPIERVRSLLAELTHMNLLTAHSADRYAFHDLLRAYAAELASADPEHGQAVHRMLDYYLHTAYACALLVQPQRDPINVDPPVPGVEPEAPVDTQHAWQWLAAEHKVLLRTIQHAASLGLGKHAWQLAWSLDDFLKWRGHWHDQHAMQNTALLAAAKAQDQLGQAYAHGGIAAASGRMGHLDDAHEHYRSALQHYQGLDNLAGQAHTHSGLVFVLNQQQHHDEALLHAEQALQLFRQAGHRTGEANSLNAVGWGHILIGNYQQALAHCQQALALLQEIGDHNGIAATMDSIGYAYHHVGQQEHAITHYQQAITLYQTIGNRYNEGETLAHLGESYHATGDTAAARVAWQQALNIFNELGHPSATQLRNRLDQLQLPDT